MTKTGSKYLEWKKNHPDIYNDLIQGILRLKKNKLSSAEIDLLTWDNHLFMTLSKIYMEKREREQIIRGLLNDSENSTYIPPKSFYEQWKERYPEIYGELKEGIDRLKKNKIPHLKSEDITETWWDDHLFMTLSKFSLIKPKM